MRTLKHCPAIKWMPSVEQDRLDRVNSSLQMAKSLDGLRAQVSILELSQQTSCVKTGSLISPISNCWITASFTLHCRSHYHNNGIIHIYYITCSFSVFDLLHLVSDLHHTLNSLVSWSYFYKLPPCACKSSYYFSKSTLFTCLYAAPSLIISRYFRCRD